MIYGLILLIFNSFFHTNLTIAALAPLVIILSLLHPGHSLTHTIKTLDFILVSGIEFLTTNPCPQTNGLNLQNLLLAYSHNTKFSHLQTYKRTLILPGTKYSNALYKQRRKQYPTKNAKNAATTI